MSFDVDIDLPNSFIVESIFPNWIKASIVKDEKLTPHPCGVYPQAIAKDFFSNLAAIPYDIAESNGYFKVDFLHNNVYNIFDSREQIEELLKIEPQWELLLSQKYYPKLFQLSNHFDLIKKVQPKSIEELADCLALIRPGKANLVDLYLTNKKKARLLLYKKTNGFSFKKSHAISYSMVIVLQLHLIEMNLL